MFQYYFKLSLRERLKGAISVKWECWWVENDLRGRQEKHSDDDGKRGWFHFWGWEKSNYLHRIFFFLVTSTQPSCCTLRMWASFRWTSPPMQDVSCRSTQSRGCSLIALVFYETEMCILKYCMYVLVQYSYMPLLEYLWVSDVDVKRRKRVAGIKSTISRHLLKAIKLWLNITFIVFVQFCFMSKIIQFLSFQLFCY